MRAPCLDGMSLSWILGFTYIYIYIYGSVDVAVFQLKLGSEGDGIGGCTVCKVLMDGPDRMVCSGLQ